MPLPQGQQSEYRGNYVSLPVAMLKAPVEGNRTIPVAWNWENAGSAPNYVVHVNAREQRVLPMTQICALHVNNLHSSVPISILFPDTQFEIQLGPNLEGYYPATTNGLEFYAYCTLQPAPADAVAIEILNFLPPPLIFGPTPGGNPVGVVTEIDTGPGLTGGPITGAGTISLQVPVAIANGGTFATTPNGALDSLSGSSGSAVGLLARNAAGAWLLSPLGAGGPPALPVSITNGGTGATTGFTALDALAGVSGQQGILERSNTGVWSLGSAGTGTITAVIAGVGMVGGGASGSVTLGLAVPVSIADGGTNATTGAAALDSLAGVSGSAAGFLSRGGTGAWGLTAEPLPIAAGGTGATTAPAALTALGAAPLASPALTGTPTGPVAAPGTNTNQLATCSFVQTAIGGPFLALTGGTLSGNLNVQGAGEVTAATTGVVTLSGPNNGLNFVDRINTGNAWGMFSNGNVLEWSYNAQPAVLSLTNAGVLNIPNEVIIGPGGQTTGQLVNINGNASPVQISAVSNSALNVRLDNGGSLLYFLFQTTTNVGTISTNGSSVAYNTTSDARLKEEITPADAHAIGVILDQLEPVEFQWRDNKELGRRLGFLAQDVAEHYPQAVTPGEGAEGDEGFRPWAIDYSAFVPLLVAEARAARQRHVEMIADIVTLQGELQKATRAIERLTRDKRNK